MPDILLRGKLMSDESKSNEVQHLKEIVETKFSHIESWMENFKNILERLTVSVEALNRQQQEIGRIDSFLNFSSKMHEEAKKKQSEMESRIISLENKNASNAVVIRGVATIAAACAISLIGIALKLVFGV